VTDFLAKLQARATAFAQATVTSPAASQAEMRFAAMSADYPEAARIAAIPQVAPSASASLMASLKRPGGAMTAWALQSQCLTALHEHGRLFAPIGVGQGKTLISLLAGTVLQAKRPLLLVPAALVAKTQVDMALFRKHFYVPPNLEILSYDKLSHRNCSAYLTDNQFDVIVADEAHQISAITSSRTRRLFRYLEANPQVKFVPMSGTFLRSSVKDFAALAWYALREGSFVPHPESRELASWAKCLDPKADPTGADLLAMEALIRLRGLVEYPTVQDCREAFRFRMRCCPGVVASDDASLDSDLVIEARFPEMPSEVWDLVRQVADTAESPNGEEAYTDDMAVHRVKRQLHQGFWYRWAWEQLDRGRDEEWLFYRREWHKQIRYELRDYADEGYDSPFLVAAQAHRELDKGAREPLHLALQDWREHSHKDAPPTVPVWVDEFLVDDALAWLAEQTQPAVIWYEDRAVGDALAARGLPVYGQGTEPPEQAIDCALSIRVHGTGKNLQHWDLCYFLAPPSSAVVMEQALGRMHRPGQKSKTVTAVFAQHGEVLPRAMVQAVERSWAIRQMYGMCQKILYAERRGLHPDVLDALRGEGDAS
jgi:hypothetical protein